MDGELAHTFLSGTDRVLKMRYALEIWSGTEKIGEKFRITIPHSIMTVFNF